MALVKSETPALGNQHSSSFASLYVGDLSPDVTEEDLIHKFSWIVPVVSVHLCCNSITGKSMCYAYINFDSPSSASKAMACLNHTDLKGKAMRMMWSQRDLSYRPRTGFGNLFSSITSSCFERLSCPFGALLSCKFAEDNGHSKGFGFVQFDQEQSALTRLRCDLAATKPRINVLIELIKEIGAKIYTTPRDARFPKTANDDNRAADPKPIPMSKRPKESPSLLRRYIDATPQENFNNTFPKHNPTLGEQVIMKRR